MPEVIVCEQHVCPSCKVAMVDSEYDRCFGCQRKWFWVYRCCVRTGWPKSLAVCKANESYPSSRGR